jgi:hypothetical protein
MRSALIIAGLLVSLAAQPQEIYRWVDKDGIVHYSDQRGSPDAELVPYRTGGERSTEAEPPQLYQSERARETPPPGQAYRSLTIVAPAPDEVFFGTDAGIGVVLSVDPELRLGDRLLVFIDGERAPDFEGLATTLTGIARGTHFLRAAVIDESGSVVISSEQINFHLRQTSIVEPLTGPAITPPPRPPAPRPPPPPGS